jgi:hypothetical protein
MFEFENFLLTFFQYLPIISPPLVGGDGGEGGLEGLYSVHPHPHPPPSKRGRGIGGEISIMFGWSLFGYWCLVLGF